MQRVVDLSKRQWDRTRGPFTLIGTWMEVGFNQTEECLAIIRAGREMHEDSQCHTIMLDDMHMWDGDDTIPLAFGVLEELDLTPTLPLALQLISFVHDSMGDVFGIKPMLNVIDDDPIAEITAVDRNSGKTMETLI